MSSSVNEPIRTSILDIVCKNLAAAGRNVYITRTTYFGEYFVDHEFLQEEVEKIINNLQKDYEDVLITGLLLVYPDYYIHILEASEDVIHKHFKLLFTEENKGKYGKAILLPTYHHVQQRFFTEWSKIFTTPPMLLGPLSAADIENQLYNCLLKIYSLCECISNVVRDRTVTINEVFDHLSEKVAQYLPESTVLQFLLKETSPVLRTVQSHVKMLTEVPLVRLYNETIWPPPCDFMPRDIVDEGKTGYPRDKPQESPK